MAVVAIAKAPASPLAKLPALLGIKFAKNNPKKRQGLSGIPGSPVFLQHTRKTGRKL